MQRPSIILLTSTRSTTKSKSNFKELGVITIPTGGCGSIKHWVTFNIIRDLNKKFLIFQDSDRLDAEQSSRHIALLNSLSFNENNDFYLTKKRELENYISPSALNRLVPGSNISYGDFDDVKEICSKHKNRDLLGKDKVLDKHFCSLTYKELKDSFEDDNNDEFLTLYQMILEKMKDKK